MRLWTAMLGAWLAAGTSAAAEGTAATDRTGGGAALDRPPAAECPADGLDRGAPHPAAVPARKT